MPSSWNTAYRRRCMHTSYSTNIKEKRKAMKSVVKVVENIAIILFLIAFLFLLLCLQPVTKEKKS
jgi:hypothetical protein